MRGARNRLRQRTVGHRVGGRRDRMMNDRGFMRETCRVTKNYVGGVEPAARHIG